MFCPKCGTQLKDLALFCHNCGHQMTEEAPVQEPVPVAAQEEAVAPKKKSRKKLIIGITAGITAGVTALAVGIGAVAIWLLKRPKPVAEEIVNYLRTKVTEYDEKGAWARTVEYTYNDQGCPTEIKVTKPTFDTIEIETGAGFVMYQDVPNGGKEVQSYLYEYNDEGHCVHSSEVTEEYNADGTLEKSKKRETGGCKYEYNDDGSIDTVPQRGFEIDYTLTEEYLHADYYHYDDDGRLIEITNRSPMNEYARESVFMDFRYDDEGRMTASCTRPMDGAQLYEYEYDKNGKLESVTLSYAACQAPIDNQHTVDLSQNAYKFSTRYEAEFEYDSEGRVISRVVHDLNDNSAKKVSLEYDDDFLCRVEFPDMVVQFTDDEGEAQRMIRKEGQCDVAMVRDENGNIVKAMHSNGSYAEYEYKDVVLDQEQSNQHETIMYSHHRIDLMGMERYIWGFGSGSGFVSYVSYPTNELYEIEVILCARY